MTGKVGPMPPPSQGCETSTPASIRAMWSGPAPATAGGPAAPGATGAAAGVVPACAGAR